MKRQVKLEPLLPPLPPLPPPPRRSSSNNTQKQPLKPPPAHIPDTLSEYLKELDLFPTTPMSTPRTDASHTKQRPHKGLVLSPRTPMSTPRTHTSHTRQRPHTAIDSRRGMLQISDFSKNPPSQTARYVTKPTPRHPRSTLQPVPHRTDAQSSPLVNAAALLLSTSRLHAAPLSRHLGDQAVTPQGTTSSFTSSTSRRLRTHAAPRTLTPPASSHRPPFFMASDRRPGENAIMAGPRNTNTGSTPRP